MRRYDPPVAPWVNRGSATLARAVSSHAAEVKRYAGDTPVFIGSGADANSIPRLKGACDGFIVGSASDRTMTDQRGLWERHRVEMDFVGHKHKLDEIRARFPDTTRWIHIGDGEADHLYAVKHGFEFYWVHEVPEDGTPGWIW